MQKCVYPGIDAIIHIPNEGKRTPREGAEMKAEGLRPGVPDLFLPVARGQYHGLFIEMKRLHGARVSDAQREWMIRLRKNDYMAVICYGFEEAVETIKTYMTEGRMR